MFLGLQYIVGVREAAFRQQTLQLQIKASQIYLTAGCFGYIKLNPYPYIPCILLCSPNTPYALYAPFYIPSMLL